VAKLPEFTEEAHITGCCGGKIGCTHEFDETLPDCQECVRDAIKGIEEENRNG